MNYFKVLLIAAVLIISNGCSKNAMPGKSQKTQKTQKAQTVQNETRSNRLFYEVDVEGDIHVLIKPSKKGSSVVLRGYPDDFPPIITEVHDGRLTIKAPTYPDSAPPVTAVVTVTQLNQLSFKGNGTVNGKNIHGSAMDLQLFINGNVNLSGRMDIRDFTVTGKNNIQLSGVSSKKMNVVMNGDVNVKVKGMTNLETIKYAGSGNLSLYWVNSPDLEVLGFGKAKVHLAGTAHYLHAITHDKSELDARYLRVNKAYVKAKDYSTIRMLPIKELNALASEHGHIYYYQPPKFEAAYMAENGAVLDFELFK